MIKFKRSILAGFVAGLAALAVAVVGGWALRFDSDVQRVLAGSPFTTVPFTAWLMAGVAALVGAIAIGVAYAFIFELVTRSAAWWIGAVMGALQAGGLWLGVGVLAGAIPGIGLVAAGELSLVFNDLFVVAWLVAFHVVYGAVVAVAYGPTKHRATDPTIVVWRELVATEKRVD